MAYGREVLRMKDIHRSLAEATAIIERLELKVSISHDAGMLSYGLSRFVTTKHLRKKFLKLIDKMYSPFRRYLKVRNLIKATLLLTLISSKLNVSGQEMGAKTKISMGAALAFPTGKSAETYRRGYGGSLVGEYNLKGNFNAVGFLGYMHFQYRKDVRARLENYGEDTHISGVIPLKVGLRYYFGGIYYAEVLGGSAFTLGENSYQAFTYSPALGACIPINDRFSADLGLRYESWIRKGESTSFYGARVGLAMVL
ncbi:hypothetical protein SAMN05421827_11878 [Pedobacter terrae]|uniref:Outer membrane protein beta-barrel domain-containing protein n=1 Tax=Pedobacter terrae TaxID=405671 RepID=A0A1G8ABX9_9SPHI|nr:hypothetical protein [Pedobacter terrae]SDH18399.1 hypothetical protein SAMN05421827_11878 [Pedobacter terrae]